MNEGRLVSSLCSKALENRSLSICSRQASRRWGETPLRL